jgi:hypothetical protein
VGWLYSRPSTRGPTDRYDRSVTGSDLSATTASGLSILQSLAATASQGQDPLASRDDAAEWLHGAGLLPADGALTGSEHAALLRLRDALRDVLAMRSARRPDPDAAGRLSRALADGRLIVAVSPAGSSELVSSARATYSNLVATVAIAVAEALR